MLTNAYRKPKSFYDTHKLYLYISTRNFNVGNDVIVDRTIKNYLPIT